MKDVTYFYEVCKAGQGADTCRYIIGNETGVHCAKMNPRWKEMVDSRPNMVALGDNCPGVEDSLSLTDVALGPARPRELVMPGKDQ